MSIHFRSFRPAAIVCGLFLVVSGVACSKEASPAAAEPGPEAATVAAAAVSEPGPSAASSAQAAPSPAADAPNAVLTPDQIPAVVARIDGKEVTREDLLARATEARAALAQRGMPPPPMTRPFLRSVLDDIIGNRLVTRDLSAQGKGAPEAEVEAQIQAIQAQFPSAEEFDKALASRGFDRARLRNDVIESIAVQSWIRGTLVPSIQVTEASAREFFGANSEQMVEPEKVHARHILIFVDAQATPEVKAEKRKAIDAARARVTGGEEFASVAQAVSEDKESAANGGDLGWFYRGQMVPPFDAAAFSLEPKTLSGVVETPFGFHLIEVLEKRAPTQLAFEQVRERIVAMLQQRALEEKVRARINELSAKSTIEILL